MNKRNERRNILIAQAAAQRIVLAHTIKPLHNPFSLLERGVGSSLRLARFHPAWIAGGIVAFAAVRSAPARKWLLNGLAAWRIVRQLTDK